MSVAAVAFYSLRELARRKLLIFLVAGGAALVLLISLGLTLFKANAPVGALPATDFSGFVLVQVSGVVSLFAWIAAVTIAVTLINHDLESGSAVSIFSKPVSRLQYALGKLVAAVLSMLVIVVILGVGTQLIILSNGGGHEAPLLKTFALISANQLTQMLLILVLTVVMNNIVAAGIGIVVVQASKILAGAHVFLHGMVDPSGVSAGGLRGILSWVDVVYWLLPRYLDSDLTREVFQATVTSRSTGPVFINVSGGLDVAVWALYCAGLFALLFVVLRRREV